MKILAVFFGLILGLAALILGGIFAVSKLTPYKYEIPRPIYKPNTEWTYTASFFNASGQIQRVDTLLATILDERIMLQQNKMTWEIKGRPETRQPTGMIENQLRMCLHPPTFNEDYTRFTQFSAYPEIHYPAKLKKRWEGKVRLLSLATEETGQSLNYLSRITAIDSLDERTRLISIEGLLDSPTGENVNVMTYKDRVGFTKVAYRLANGERMDLELVSGRRL